MKILIVDDILEVAKYFKSDLEFWGHSAEYVLCGASAVDTLKKDNSYDFVLMDYWQGNVLPHGDFWRNEIMRSNQLYKDKVYIYSAWSGLEEKLPFFLKKKDAVKFINKISGIEMDKKNESN